jgi:hypothetical protein
MYLLLSISSVGVNSVFNEHYLPLGAYVLY